MSLDLKLDRLRSKYFPFGKVNYDLGYHSREDNPARMSSCRIEGIRRRRRYLEDWYRQEREALIDHELNHNPALAAMQTGTFDSYIQGTIDQIQEARRKRDRRSIAEVVRTFSTVSKYLRRIRKPNQEYALKPKPTLWNSFRYTALGGIMTSVATTVAFTNPITTAIYGLMLGLSGLVAATEIHQRSKECRKNMENLDDSLRKFLEHVRQVDALHELFFFPETITIDDHISS